MSSETKQIVLKRGYSWNRVVGGEEDGTPMGLADGCGLGDAAGLMEASGLLEGTGLRLAWGLVLATGLADATAKHMEDGGTPLSVKHKLTSILETHPQTTIPIVPMKADFTQNDIQQFAKNICMQFKYV